MADNDSRHRPDFWDTATKLVGLLARLASLAEVIRRIFM
jgi:hypothetical protein